MRHLAAAILILAMSILGPSTAFAEDGMKPLAPSGAEYSADRQITVKSEEGEKSLNQKVYHAANKERSEMEMSDRGRNMKMVMILRQDKKVGWSLFNMPQMGTMYSEVKLDEAKQKTGEMEIQSGMTPAGEEVVEGVPCDKYKCISFDRQSGRKYAGYLWLSKKDKVMMKMDGIGKNADGEKNRVTLVLKNLKVAKQDAALFELPADAKPMPSMGGMGMGGAIGGFGR